MRMIKSCRYKNEKFIVLNVTKYSWYLEIYFVIFICLYTLYSTNCIQQAKKLTNLGNKHTTGIDAIKVSQDYTKVYSLQRGPSSQLKIWDFNITNLQLRQTIYISYNIRWHFAEAIFQWNYGDKLYVGADNVYIYTLNSSNNLYISPPTVVLIPLGSSIYSVWVNTAGDKMYVATDRGCRLLNFISPNWVQNTPSFLTTLGTRIFSLIIPVNNQQKLIIVDYTYQKLIILKQNGSIYSSHQNISTGIIHPNNRNCYISSNQLYICCYGGATTNILTKFNCYKLNPSTNFYQNITIPNQIPQFTNYAYMNKNQIYTVAQYNSKLLHKYKFTNTSGFFQYTLIASYSFNGQRPSRITYQRDNSNFQLISTYSGNIYIITPKCYYKVYLYNCQMCYPDRSICLQCKENFNLVSGTCVCPFPLKQVSGFCNNFTDRGLLNCISAKQLSNSTIICLFCSLTQNQILFNNSCVCKAGYHDSNSTGICTDICGDGFLFESQCDDLNIFPGDGCNQFCQIQPGFQCNFINNQSVCKSETLLKYSQPTQILRDKTSNKAILKLKVLNSKNLLPFLINKLNFVPQNNYISLFASNYQSSIQFRFEKLSLLQIDQDYIMYIQFQFIQNFTLEGSSARIELNYQNTKYSNYTQKIQFLMEGSNMPLDWSNNLNSYKNIAIFNLVIIIFSILILLIGLFTPKFIGLETILTLQLIFFSQFLIQKLSNWPVGFSYLQNLKFSTGYNDILHFSSIIPQRTLQIKFQNLSIKKHVIQNLNISFLVIFIAISISLFWLSYRFFYQRKIVQLKQNYRYLQNPKQKQQISQKIKEFQTKIQKTYFLSDKFYNTVSQLSFWIILPFFSALSAYLLVKEQYVEFINKQIGQNLVQKAGVFIIFFLFVSFILVCLNNFANILVPHKKWIQVQTRKKQQILYKRALFLYLMLIAYLIFFSNNKILFFNLPASSFALFFQILFILILVIINPYRQSLKIHTTGLLINHLVYTTFLAIINIINFVQNIEEIIILVFGYFIVVSSFITIILSIIRLYYQYRYGQNLEIKIEKERQQQEAKEKLREKQKLQRKINQLERQKKNQLSQKQKQRAGNQYLYENQKQQQEKIELLEWLKKKTWTQDMKQQYYHTKYAQKPLSWLKIHDLTKYHQKITQSTQPKNLKPQNLSQKLQKQSQPLPQPIQYSNLLTQIKQSHHRKIKSLLKKHKNHDISMKHDPTYNMKISQQNLYKFIKQEYQLKD